MDIYILWGKHLKHVASQEQPLMVFNAYILDDLQQKHVIQYEPWDSEAPEQFHDFPELNITGKLVARGKSSKTCFWKESLHLWWSPPALMSLDWR
jgi:hypothetical protein